MNLILLHPLAFIAQGGCSSLSQQDNCFSDIIITFSMSLVWLGVEHLSTRTLTKFFKTCGHIFPFLHPIRHRFIVEGQLGKRLFKTACHIDLNGRYVNFKGCVGNPMFLLMEIPNQSTLGYFFIHGNPMFLLMQMQESMYSLKMSLINNIIMQSKFVKMFTKIQLMSGIQCQCWSQA